MACQIDRREFIKRAMAAASFSSISSAPPPRPDQPELERRGAAKKVIVIGAGLAGLSAAYELSQAGHDVSVLEARARAGGRVRTLREPFADGMYAEAGAMNVFNNHDWTMKYIQRFRIVLEPSVPSNLGSLVYMRGRRIVMKRGQTVDWPLTLSAEEIKLGRRGLWDKYVGPAVKVMGDTEDVDWPPEGLKKYDQITFLEFLRRQDPSPDALALLKLGFADQLGDGADVVSALDLLRESAQRARMSQSSTILGGSDMLPMAFATRLADKIHYGAPVIRIEHDTQGARAICSQAGGRHTFAADYLVCALPFTCLKRIEIAPGFSPAKQKAIEELQLTSVTRVYMQTSRRFWVDEGLSGGAITDLPVQTVYHHNPHQSERTGARGILESYVAGPQARLLARMRENERIGTTLTGVEKFYAAIREHFEGGASYSWDEDEWARGAYTWFKPGQMTSLLPHIARPEGRVHFAGEHASSWPGWMQGALEAGNRVAREINDSP